MKVKSLSLISMAISLGSLWTMGHNRTYYWLTHGIFTGSCPYSDRYYGKVVLDFSPQEVLDLYINGYDEDFSQQAFAVTGLSLSQLDPTSPYYIGLKEAYGIGFGIGGDYADEWLEVFPPITPEERKTFICGTFSQYTVRKNI